jgi:hypothetical protein
VRHQTEDAYVVDRGATRAPAGTIEQHGDPPVAVGRPRVGELADGGDPFVIVPAAVAAAESGCGAELLR